MDKLAKTDAQAAIERIKEGLYLDEFAKDKRATVRAAVVRYHPQYRKAVFEKGVTPVVWQSFYEVYWVDAQPDVAMLKRFLSVKKPETVNVFDENVKRLRYKLKAMTEKPTVMTATMTREQLYQAGSALWARDLTAEQLDVVDTMKYWLKEAKLTSELPHLLDKAYAQTAFNFSQAAIFVDNYIARRAAGYSIEDAVANSSCN